MLFLLDGLKLSYWRRQRVAGQYCLFIGGLWLAIAGGLVGGANLYPGLASASEGGGWLAPADLTLTVDGKSLYVGCARTPRILVVNVQDGAIRKMLELKEPCTGLALVENPPRLVVTGSGRTDFWACIDRRRGETLLRQETEPGACSPVVSPKRNLLYVCNRFSNAVTVFNLRGAKQIARLGVVREPVAVAVTPDKRLLLVANHLPAGQANAEKVAAAVTFIETDSFAVRTHILLPTGSTSVRGIAVCPTGKWCAVAHNFARFQLATTQVEHGWMNDFFTMPL
jgi:hypothetical protein